MQKVPPEAGHQQDSGSGGGPLEKVIFRDRWTLHLCPKLETQTPPPLILL